MLKGRLTGRHFVPSLLLSLSALAFSGAALAEQPQAARGQRHERDVVIGGSVNRTGSFVFRVTRVGEETVLQQIVALVRDAQAVADALPQDAIVVLLGSVASGKYVNVLLEVFGERLRFPAEFVGRGDMSRGGLMLRCVDHGTELEYVAVSGTPRRGARPPKLEPRR